MKYIFLFLIIVFIPFPVLSETHYVQFFSLPELPPNAGMISQPGLAGPYTGTDDDVLIVAGGANFPEKLPWEGGAKVYYDEIFVLSRNDDGTLAWRRMPEKIPFRAAYGGAVETAGGLLCFGGNTDNDCISQSWYIDYLPESGKIQVKPGPELPVPLTTFAYAKVDGYVYVAGGITEPGGASGMHFFRLELMDAPAEMKDWQALPSWQGKPRAFAVGAGQSNGAFNCFYLFSGRNVLPGADPEILYDAHVYDPFSEAWQIISLGNRQEFPFMAGTAFPLGAATIVFPSGANGHLMQKQVALDNQIASLQKVSGKEELLDSLQNARVHHLNNHPGFGNRLMAFNTLTHEVYELGNLPQTGQVTTRAVPFGEQYVIPSGEIRPGVRTPTGIGVGINTEIRHLNMLDVVVIILYFLVLAWMGYYFSKRQKSTADYFKGGGRVPWWAAGLSIFGTALSAITFMAIPAKTFASDWSYFILNMTIFLAAPIIVFMFIPFYRKLDITTAYEYLELRFNLVVRLLGSLSFILFQIGRMGVVMFLPSIALNVVTGINIFVCIGLMGIISLIYTMMGGIEAVIWTDVMQVIVLLGGAVLSLILIIIAVDGGFPAIIDSAVDRNKFNAFDFTWSLRQPTVWVMLLGGLFTNIITYGTDQTMVQRYLTTKTQREAVKSVWTNAVLAIPATLIFFFIGTALFAFYTFFPAELNPTFSNNDAIFPWYIASQLPAGISGLLIAGIFAAAMSSLSSSMNSAATAYATDFHFRFKWNQKVSELSVARIATLVVGITGTLFAVFMATMDVKSLWDEFQKILGLVIGSLGGVFLLGILTKRVHSAAVLSGIAGSIVVQILVAMYEPVHLIVFSATGVISCFVIGYTASYLLKPIEKNDETGS